MILRAAVLKLWVATLWGVEAALNRGRISDMLQHPIFALRLMTAENDSYEVATKCIYGWGRGHRNTKNCIKGSQGCTGEVEDQPESFQM